MGSLSSMPDTRLKGSAALINNLLVWVPGAGAIALFVWVRRGGPFWALIPALALIALAVWLGGRHFKQAWLKQHRRDTAQADTLLDDDATIVLRRRLRFGWPLALTLGAGLFAFFSLATDAWPVMIVTTLPLLVVALIWWTVARRRTRPLGVVSAKGLRLGDETFPWERVGVSAESLVGYRGRRGRRDLVVTLAGDPREFRIPLSELVGTPAVIHQVIDGHVQRERDKRMRAEMERKTQALHERLKAHPEDKEVVARDLQQEFEQDMRETRERIAEFDARMAQIKSRSIWSSPPGAIPMKWQWTIVGIVFAWVAFTYFALRTSFYKSPEWTRVSLYVSLVATVVLSIWAIRALLKRVAKSGRFSVVLITPLLIGMTVWLPVATGLPDLYTRVAGKAFSIEQEMRLEYVRGKTCKLRVYAPLFDRGNLSSYYCASLDEINALVDSKTMRARGTETWFGKHIDRVEPK